MDFHKDQENDRTKIRERKPIRGYIATGSIGAILGVAIMSFGLPYVQGEFSADDSSSVKSDYSESTSAGKVTTVNVKNVNFTDSVAKTIDSVVGVTNLKRDSSPFGGGSSLEESGSGSGVIYKKTGNKAYVVTNNHVIEGANEVEVSLKNKTKVKAKVLGSDSLMDLAVLEIEGNSLPKAAEIGNSDALKPGEPVATIGNPLGYLDYSITQGIVSNPKRIIPIDVNQDQSYDWEADVIQTDASINPGNSGGALINVSGQLIGINSMKIAQEGVEGIGFAIPMNTAVPIIESLEKKGKVTRPYIGVGNKSLDEISLNDRKQYLNLPNSVKSGVVILQVSPNSPASRAGLEENDVITAIDGDSINSSIALRKYLYTRTEPGKKVTIEFYRNGEKRETEVTLEEQNS
ncbi:S1C family serine protease [Peribacillus sp. SCS-37]|uniref:S1C family serine protease n=1 Tax=Paraperibacillus esterisolvens TaxID=3115296 RepID=UPI0039066C12